MAADLIGGRYRLDSLLGAGGMSEVWCADDVELGRRVALKLLAPDADRARFAREARAAAALAHPNLTQLYDYGDADGRPFMVLEYLPGGSLEERLAPGLPLGDEEAARVAGDVAAGLAHAHARGLVHRDLKPANVLFDEEGRAKIADFGIARLGQGGTLTEAGTLLGTAAYLSPEQAAGEPATAASDVYSFGVMLYRLLTGRLPFVSDDALALVALHRDATPPPLEELRTEAPAALAAVAAAALAKDPAARPPDGAALVAALSEAGAQDRAAAGGAAVTAADTASTRVLAAPPAPPRRRRTALALGGALALLGAAGVALAFGVARPGGGPATEQATFPPAARRGSTTHGTSATIAPSLLTAPGAGTTTAATTAAATTRSARPKKRPRPTTVPSVTITLPTATATISTVTTAPTDTTTTAPPPTAPPPTGPTTTGP